jgi:hypothetical protein
MTIYGIISPTCRDGFATMLFGEKGQKSLNLQQPARIFTLLYLERLFFPQC